MENPIVISESNKSVPASSDSSNIIDKLEELGCATWHPLFIDFYRDQALDYVKKNVKYDSLNLDNKWGYQYHISTFLKGIPIDLENYLSVKNYVVLNDFTYYCKEGKNYYSVRNPKSIYEVFWYWIGHTFNINSSSWNDTELEDLRNLHQKFKEKSFQYSFFTIDEMELDILTRAYLHLMKKESEDCG
tara:strand:- start:325 stop:888 length:564 start_codon:yes stop_codon:yes gene_type:complete